MKDSMEVVKNHLNSLERWIWHNQTEDGVVEELDEIQKYVVKIDRSIDVAKMMNKVMVKQARHFPIGLKMNHAYEHIDSFLGG